MGLLSPYIALDKRRVSTTGENAGKYHVKVWVRFRKIVNGEHKPDQTPYVTGFYLTEDDYILMMDDRKKTKRDDLREVKKQLNSLVVKANDIIDRLHLGQDDKKKFDLFFTSNYNIQTLGGQFEYKIGKLLQLDKPETERTNPKISSAEKYSIALRAFQAFGGDNVTFNEIDKDWLERYQEWFIKPNEEGKSKSLTSVGIYLRHLRAIFNQAIQFRLISPDIYPFGINGYVIPEGSAGVKQFLDPEEKDKFLEFESSLPHLNEGKDYGAFSYFANGINFADIANLRVRDDFGDYFKIDRKKTKGKKKKSVPIIIPVRQELRDIIYRRGNKTLNPNNYIFPILNDSMTPKEKFNATRNFVKIKNRALITIGKQLGFGAKLTTYVLRHTYSNMVMEMGGTTEELQFLLGHGNKKTTENYKHGFALARNKKFSEGL